MNFPKLLVRLVVYYFVLVGIVWGLVAAFPELADYLPVGGAETLLVQQSSDPFDAINIAGDEISNVKDSMIWLTFAILGTLLVMTPVSWTYIQIRHKDGFDQSLVETMILLPTIVTGIVVVVHNSLALAFSLAGIVAGVRFRNTLKSSADALFVFAAIGVGLAAGVGAIEIAFVVTMAFNLSFVVLWELDYGSRKHTNRYMNKSHKKPKDEHAGEHEDETPEADV